LVQQRYLNGSKKTISKKSEIENVISKGALVKEDNRNNAKKFTHLNFRIPTSMLFMVDEALEERVGISRNGWILEAIHEKLKGIE